MARIYEDCELVIQASGERYLAQLSNIHAGEASGEFALPFTQVELSNFYSRIGQAHRATRGGATPDVEAAKRFGDQLFRSVFAGEMLSQLRASVDHAHEHGHGLRLRLRLKNVPDLGELPWEFLYDREQDHFIATSTMTPMVRYLDLPQNVSTLRVRAPLRVLVVLAGPRNLPLLDAEGEWQRLKATLGPLEAAGAICLERLPDGTLATLRRRARGDPFHILHFVGHGGFDTVAGDGVLHFENTTCLSDPIAGQMLGSILRDHDTLRLVVLNACEGARQSDQNPFSGVAQSLCQQRMPAVIAMQFEISDDAAKTFAEEFYGAVADGLPVDAAVSESRKALYSGRFGQEWATPVLYMRSPSGLLFDIQKKPKPAVQPEPAKPIEQAATPIQQPVQQQPVQQQPVQPRPAPPPPPPPRPAFDIEAERRKLDAERARIESERIQRERAAADAEARHRNEEERLKEERLRFEQEQEKARIAAEAQRRREEQERRQREEQARREDQQRREQLAAQQRMEQERARLEEEKRQQKEREAAAAKAAAGAAPRTDQVHSPPPPPGQQPMAFASVGAVAPPQKSHRIRKGIIVTFAVIGAVLLTLLIIGLIVGSNESKVNHMRAGEQAMAARNFDEAITHFKAAVAKHPEMAEAHARLCNAIALKGENSPGHKGDYAAAVAACEEAVKRNPESAEAHSNLCNALNDRVYDTAGIGGDYNRAVAECRHAVKLDANNAEAWNNLCNVIGTRAEQNAYDPKDRKEALDACKESIRLNPNLADAHKNLGDLYRDYGDDALEHPQYASSTATHYFSEAAAEYRQAINIRPDYEQAELGLGNVFYKSNKPEPAVEELNKAVKLDPSDYAAHYWLGNVYFLELKQNDQAITEFKRVVELKPDLANGEYALSQVYRAQGDTSEANDHLKSAYNINSNDKAIADDYKRYIASGSSSLRSAPVPAIQQGAASAPVASNNSLGGWYAGNVVNVTFHKESRAAIYLEQTGRQLHGCLLVYPPLGGSGPLIGSVESSTVLLWMKAPQFIIGMSGNVEDGKLAGSYVVRGMNPPNSEVGRFSLTRSNTAILASINVNACPSDADTHASAG